MADDGKNRQTEVLRCGLCFMAPHFYSTTLEGKWNGIPNTGILDGVSIVDVCLSKGHFMAVDITEKLEQEQLREWNAAFAANTARPLKTRFRYSFIKTYKPVLDDASYRAFDTMEEYRQWCEANLPDWLGYGRV